MNFLLAGILTAIAILAASLVRGKWGITLVILASILASILITIIFKGD